MLTSTNDPIKICSCIHEGLGSLAYSVGETLLSPIKLFISALSLLPRHPIQERHSKYLVDTTRKLSVLGFYPEAFSPSSNPLTDRRWPSYARVSCILLVDYCLSRELSLSPKTVRSTGIWSFTPSLAHVCGVWTDAPFFILETVISLLSEHPSLVQSDATDLSEQTVSISSEY